MGFDIKIEQNLTKQAIQKNLCQNNKNNEI